MTIKAKHSLKRLAWVLAISSIVSAAARTGDALAFDGAERLNKAQSGFALRLMDKLAAAQPGANIVISPASLAGALSVIERGGRSEERRVGKECRLTCRSRWSPYH